MPPPPAASPAVATARFLRRMVPAGLILIIDPGTSTEPVCAQRALLRDAGASVQRSTRAARRSRLAGSPALYFELLAMANRLLRYLLQALKPEKTTPRRSRDHPLAAANSASPAFCLLASTPESTWAASLHSCLPPVAHCPQPPLRRPGRRRRPTTISVPPALPMPPHESPVPRGAPFRRRLPAVKEAYFSPVPQAFLQSALPACCWTWIRTAPTWNAAMPGSSTSTPAVPTTGSAWKCCSRPTAA